MPTIEKTTSVAIKDIANYLHLRCISCVLLLISFSNPIFSQIYPNPNDLHTGSDGAGGDLPDGSLDLIWDVAHGPDGYTGGTLPTSLSYVDATVTGNCAVGAWVDPYPNGKWISFDFGEEPPCEHNDVGDVDLFFKTEFSLPSMGPCNTPINGGWCLVLDYLGDNQVFQIFVNGIPQLTAMSANYDFEGFKYPNRETQELCDDWINGNNEIVVHIKSGPNAEGFLAQARIPIIPNATDPVCIVTDVIVNLNSVSDQDTITFDLVDNGSYSPCNTFATSLSQEIFTIDDVGNNTVTLFLMNSGGATTSCEFNVLVNGPDCSCDNTPPIFDSLPDTIMDISCDDPLPPFQYLTAIDDIDVPIVLECIDVTVSIADDTGNPNDCIYFVDTEDYDISVLQSCEGIMSLTHNLPNQNDTTLYAYHFPIGVTPILWIATDSSGNTLLDTCYFTVVDDTAPNIECPENLIVTEGQDGDIDDIYFVQGNILDAVASDFCQNLATLTNDVNNSSTLSGHGFAIGTHLIIWTAIDSDGNSSTCQVELQVFEEGAIINPDVENTQLRTSENNIHQVNIVNQKKRIAKRNTSTSRSVADPSGVEIITSVDPFVVDMCNGYEITYRWTAIDSCGNSSSVTETFNLLPDTAPPVMMCQDIVVSLDGTGTASLTPEMFDNGSMDACNWMDLSIDITEVDCSDIGQDIVVTLTGADECGNIDTCTAIVEVQDETPPQVTCTMDILFSDSSDGNNDCQHQNSGTILDPVAIFDNCSGNFIFTNNYASPVSNTTLDGAIFPVGTTIVVWTVTDMSGNVSTCDITITVIDNEDPICIDQGVIDIIINSDNEIAITESLLTLPFTDQCGIASILFDPPTLSCDESGIVDVIATVTDESGNSIECPIQFNVIADENISCELNIDTLYLDETGMAELDESMVNLIGGGCNQNYTISFDNTFFSCNDVAISPTNINIFVNGELCGIDNITVLDTISPVISCVDYTISCIDFESNFNSIHEYVNSIPLANSINITDNCPNSLFITSELDSSGLNECGYGFAFRSITIEDPFSMTNEICVQTISIEGPADPITQSDIDMLLQSDVVIDCSVDLSDLDTISVDDLSALTDCGLFEINFYDLLISSECPDTIFRTYEITAVCQNETFIFSQHILKIDTTPPVINCNSTVFLVASDSIGGNCSAIYNSNVDNPIVTDDCSYVTLSHDYSAAPSSSSLYGAIFNNQDTINVTFTATDECDNISQCSQLIIVLDGTAPNCIANDITINLDQNGMYTLSDQEALTYCTYTDNCEIDSSSIKIQLPKNDFNCADVGTNFQYIFMVADQFGNQSDCIGNITVQEGPNSALCIPTDITVSLNDNGIVTIVPSDIASSSSSSCGMINSIISQTTFDCNDIGDNLVLITTSNDFSTDTCSATVTVIDEIEPTCNAQDITVSLDTASVYCLTPSDFDSNISPTLICTDLTIGLVPLDTDGDNVPDSESVTLDVNSLVVDASHPLGIDFELSFSPTSIVTTALYDCNDIGVNQVTIYAIDIFGNTTSCIALVEVEDNNNVDICASSGICTNLIVSIQDPTLTTDTITPEYFVDLLQIDTSIYSLSFTQDTTDDMRVYDCSDLGENLLTIWSYDGLIVEEFCNTILLVLDPDNHCGTGSIVGSGKDQESTVRMVPNSQAFFDNCAIDTILFSPSKLTCDDFGDNIINITVIDESGNSSQCSSTVTLENNMAPICESTDTTIYLGQLECSVVPELNLPIGENLCGGMNVISYIPGEYQPGDEFPIGTSIINYNIIAPSGLSSTCQYTISVIDYQVTAMSCKDVNVSLNETCETEITPSMVLSGSDYGCLDSCKVTITDLDDNPIPNMLNGSHAGHTFKVKVCCGDNCCWSYVTVEDKLPPIIECKDTMVTCIALDNFDAADITSFPGVTLVSECSPASLILVNEHIEDVSCHNQDVIAYVTRSWKAISEFGIESEICTQNIGVRKLDLDEIQFPHLVRLDCTESGLIDQEPSVDMLGVPTIGSDTIQLYPTPSTACNLLVRYEDQVLIDNSCKKKIMRMWTVNQWHCSDEDSRNFAQFIEITDQEGPTVMALDSLHLSTSAHECEGKLQMPVPDIYDNCSDQFEITVNTGLGNYDISKIVHIPIGTSEVIYQVTDECGNITHASTYVTIEDLTQPVVICDQTEVISIGLDTYSKLPASAIDAGSYDECSDVSLQIARMNDPEDGDTLIFRDYARYYCGDVGEYVMAVLQVTDASGNINQCMMEVEVQDKVEGRLICPQDVTIDCDTGINEADLSYQFGEPTVLDNCPGNLVTRDYLQGQLSACGSGQLSRVILLESSEGEVLDSCIQNIYVIPANPFSYDDIEWPELEFVYEGCKDVEVPIDSSGIPIINTDFCQLAGMRYEDQIFDFSIDGACQKIIRKWVVVDWCQSESDGSLVEYTFDQVIKINNIIDPIITNIPLDTTFCSFDAGCDSILISDYLQATAVDDCTIESELLKRVEVYRQPYNELLYQGNSLDANGKYAIGEYSVKFIVEDRCGNQVNEEVFFGVKNCNTPTPYCLSGLSSTLIAWDTDGDGEVDSEMLMITPDFFDAGSYHACGYDVQLSFSEDINDTLKIYNCEDIGLQEVEIWVTDQLGNQDFCVTEIDVQDNDGVAFCDDGLISELGSVDGRIYTEMDIPLSNTEVYMTSQYELMRNSDDDGIYAFPSVPYGANMIISPFDDNDHLNGVSTLDLVKIQRHILGLDDLDSPYKMIAADVNNDEKLTASDLLVLRKVILGVEVGFENNTSWRFIDESHNFEDKDQPWLETLPEEYEIVNFSDNMHIDFIAVKTGDVNESATLMDNNIESTRRTQLSYDIKAQDKYVEAGEQFKIVFKIDGAESIFGLQAELSIENISDLRISSKLFDLTENSYNLLDNSLRISLNMPESNIENREHSLFEISGIADASGLLSEFVALNIENLHPEIYLTEKLIAKKLYLDWKLENGFDFIMKQNTPNPWQNQTSIEYTLESAGQVDLRIHDIQGQLVYKKNIESHVGKNVIVLDRSSLGGSGVFIYEMIYDGLSTKRKMLLLE